MPVCSRKGEKLVRIEINIGTFSGYPRLEITVPVGWALNTNN